MEKSFQCVYLQQSYFKRLNFTFDTCEHMQSFSSGHADHMGNVHRDAHFPYSLCYIQLSILVELSTHETKIFDRMVLFDRELLKIETNQK